MGGKRKSLENEAESRIKTGAAQRQQQSGEFEGELAARSKDAQARSTSTNNYLQGSGIFDPTKLSEDVTASSYGRGREGYQNFADTGGFSPEDKEHFMERSTSHISGIYGREGSELNRRAAMTGNFNPGITASRGRLARMESQDTGNAKADAQVQLSNLVREGKLAGLSGLERTREAAGQEATGLYSQAQRFGEGQQQAVSQADILRLQNRVSTGQLDANDIAMLVSLRNNSQGVFSQIMQGIKTGADAFAGAAGAATGGKGF